MTQKNADVFPNVYPRISAPLRHPRNTPPWFAPRRPVTAPHDTLAFTVATAVDGGHAARVSMDEARRRARVALLAVAAGNFMVFLAMMPVSAVLPTVATAFGVSEWHQITDLDSFSRFLL